MNKFRFVFLVLALILVVGMTTGVIVRKQTGGQTVMQHSNASVPASTTPATTGDDEPAAPEAKVFKIPVLIREGISQYFTVIENGVEVDPIDVFEISAPSSESESKGSDETYSEMYVRYLVDPTCSSVEYDHDLRPADPWFHYLVVYSNYNHSSCFHYYYNEENQRSGSFVLSGYFSLIIH